MENMNNITNDQWNANLYDSKHSFVSDFGADVVELLAPKRGEHILDLGCGTGDLAKKLDDLGVRVVGVDKSANMVKQAQTKYPLIPFAVYDTLDLPYTDEFDAVFSNAVLHWVKQPKQALENIYKCIKDGGRFVAEMGGKGNIQMITDEVRKQFQKCGVDFPEERFPWYYPSIGEYTSIMEEVGFQVVFAHHFDRPTPLTGENGLNNWLKMFGGTIFAGLEENVENEIIEKTVNGLRPSMYANDTWIADYKRLRVVAIKNV